MNPTIPDFYPPGTTVEPSKACVDCLHYHQVAPLHRTPISEKTPGSPIHLCMRNGLRCDPVTGNVLPPDKQPWCFDERDSPARCGYTGIYWKAKDAAPASSS